MTVIEALAHRNELREKLDKLCREDAAYESICNCQRTLAWAQRDLQIARRAAKREVLNHG